MKIQGADRLLLSPFYFSLGASLSYNSYIVI
jgi:hypothetical protein